LEFSDTPVREYKRIPKPINKPAITVNILFSVKDCSENMK